MIYIKPVQKTIKNIHIFAIVRQSKLWVLIVDNFISVSNDIGFISSGDFFLPIKSTPHHISTTFPSNSTLYAMKNTESYLQNKSMTDGWW